MRRAETMFILLNIPERSVGSRIPKNLKAIGSAMSREEDLMKALPVILGLLLFCGLNGAANADIYSWTDADGIRHFSNHAPPEGAKVVAIDSELPYVEPSDEELQEAQQAERLSEAQRKIAEIEAERIERQRADERKIEESNQKATQALLDAPKPLKAREKKSSYGKKTVYD
jgi:TolA-binding protein